MADLLLREPPRQVPRSVQVQLFASRFSTHVTTWIVGVTLWVFAFAATAVDVSMLRLQGNNLGRIQGRVLHIEALNKVNGWHYRFTVDGVRYFAGVEYLSKEIPSAKTVTVEYARDNPSIFRLENSVNHSRFSVWTEIIATLFFLLLWLVGGGLSLWFLTYNWNECQKWIRLLRVGVVGQAQLTDKPRLVNSQAYYNFEFEALGLSEPQFQISVDVKDYNNWQENQPYAMLYHPESPQQRCLWLALPGPPTLNAQGELLSQPSDYYGAMLLSIEIGVIFVGLAAIGGWLW